MPVMAVERAWSFCWCSRNQPEHPARKYMQTTQRPAYFNARIQSLALSVAHYVLRTTDEHNPYWSCNTQEIKGLSGTKMAFLQAALNLSMRLQNWRTEENILEQGRRCSNHFSIYRRIKTFSDIKNDPKSKGASLVMGQCYLWYDSVFDY